MPFTLPVNVRYLEVDQQGVVFNMWYLAYMDDAMTGLLAAGGLPYLEMLDAGYDVQVVHTELDWRGSLRFGRPASVVVQLEQLGTTSFTLQFDLRDGERVAATGRTTYVTVATDGSGKIAVPERLRGALTKP